MDPTVRQWFNQQFRPAHYERLLAELHRQFPGALDFRVAESPIFLNTALWNRLEAAGNEIVDIITRPEFLAQMDSAIPEAYRLPGEPPHPAFLQIDFALVQQADGTIVPRLIELQGFPTLYCFQHLLGKAYQQVYHLPDTFAHLAPPWTPNDYLQALRDLLLGDHAPENVVLMDIFPHRQKTRIDFYCTQHHFGITPVCFTEIIHEKGRLYYQTNGRRIPIHRIYSRLIFDEVKARGIPVPDFWKTPLSVEWIGHPNWYFKLSKYALPFIQSPCCPRTYFLSEVPLQSIDPSQFVLKPLFSFAGAGVQLAPSRRTLQAIPNPEQYILQEKVNYAPVIRTPDGGAKVEFRLMYIWNDVPRLATNLVRLSKGKMMGVDFNRNRQWVGSTIAFRVPNGWTPSS